MEFSGTVQKVLPVKTFPKKDGTEGKQQVIVVQSLGTQYPTLLAIDLNDKFAEKIKVGEEGTFSVNVESREWNEKYFTTARLWKWDKVGSTTQAPSNTPTVSNFQEEDPSDLPF